LLKSVDQLLGLDEPAHGFANAQDILPHVIQAIGRQRDDPRLQTGQLLNSPQHVAFADSADLALRLRTDDVWPQFLVSYHCITYGSPDLPSSAFANRSLRDFAEV
jgi:hypothetical protein